MKQSRFSSGSVLGGMLLISGSCIGAGMLALPILTGLAGFFPSLLSLFMAWGFMTFTALLLLEVNGHFTKEVNLLSMVEESLGVFGRWVAWVSYVFLFYSLLVAYISISGSIFSATCQILFDLSIPHWISSLFFTLFFGWIIYLGTRITDFFNRVLMAGLILAYFGMIGVGICRIEPKLLLHWAPRYVFSSLPVLAISFGFQNMIPSLSGYAKGDVKKVRLMIFGGSLISLLVYLVWSVLVLGILPFEGENGILQSYQKGVEATVALQAILGSHWITYFAQGFAFFAIATSFLAQGLALVHFLADGFKVDPTRGKTDRFVLLALLPPLIFAFYNPNIFFQALNFAGGICTMVLFGILPIFMVWIGRYKKKCISNYHVSGGKAALLVAFIFTLFVIVCELIRLFSF